MNRPPFSVQTDSLAIACLSLTEAWKAALALNVDAFRIVDGTGETPRTIAKFRTKKIRP